MGDTDEFGLRADALELNDPPALIWVRVKDAIGLLWKENPKLHDMGGVIVSIQKHGLQEIPKFDTTLQPETGGAIKAGNGRIEALFRMEQDRMPLPRGLGRHKETGDWVMPLLTGVDAPSRALARAYAVDSNNLTLAGGDLTAYDMARVWNRDGYLELLQSLAMEGEFPVTVSGDDLDALLSMVNFDTPNLDDLEDEYGEPDEEKYWPVIRLQVPPEVIERYQSLMALAPGKQEHEKFDHLMRCVDTVALGDV